VTRDQQVDQEKPGGTGMDGAHTGREAARGGAPVRGETADEGAPARGAARGESAGVEPGRRSPFARWVSYRRRRIEAQVERGRESRIPTWALAVFLVVFMAGWIAFVALAG
jgi:hypothetical protein